MKDGFGFNIDNPFFDFMGTLADIVIVNILFLICSVPLITMGASVSAMYQTMQRMREGRLVSASRFFFGAFRSSFKKSLPAWSLQLVTGCLLFFDLSFAGRMQKTLFWNIVGMGTGALLLLWIMTACYLMPAGIYKHRKLKDAVAGSLYLAVRNLPYTFVMAVLNALPAVCMIMGPYTVGRMVPVYITAGFAVTAYLNAMVMEKCKGIPENEAG